MISYKNIKYFTDFKEFCIEYYKDNEFSELMEKIENFDIKKKIFDINGFIVIYNQKWCSCGEKDGLCVDNQFGQVCKDVRKLALRNKKLNRILDNDKL
jgi:hypothetical protein